jgi:long-chain acyl-CoA synthetase
VRRQLQAAPFLPGIGKKKRAEGGKPMAVPHGPAEIDAARNLAALFFARAAELGDKPLLWAKRGGAWKALSWSETRATAIRLARGLAALGIRPGDRVVIAMENRPEWCIAEVAILALGAIAVPAYATNTAADHQHILDNVKAKAALVSTRKLAAQLLPAALNSSACDFVVMIEPPPSGQQALAKPVHAWEAVLRQGEAAANAGVDEIEARAGERARSDTAVVIHTSGTGGAPRGVMLHHGSILCNVAGAWRLLGRHIVYGAEKFLCFLPLSHAYEHAGGQWVPIAVGAEIYYAESLDALVGNMADVKPTIMTAVPRLYEVMHARVAKAMAGMKGFRKTLFERAVAIGVKRYEKKPLTLGERLLDPLLDLLVRNKVRARFGGRLKFFVSGGAALNAEVGLFFTALGVTLLQGYGQTEAGPVISANPVEGMKIHSVGPPLPGVECRIAEDGEILVRGELVMQGYYGDPDTTALVVRDGWLHTGDVGLIDADGHLVITDRKKDIIVNSGGDNVSPARVEGFLTLQPEIAQAMVYGDKKPHLVAVIVPDGEAAAAWARANRRPADPAALAADAQFHDHVSKAVERVNLGLAQTERVRRFVLAKEPFTTDNGMLTPSMKIRRHVIRGAYGAALEALYGRR